jgi:hypothetical protein
VSRKVVAGGEKDFDRCGWRGSAGGNAIEQRVLFFTPLKLPYTERDQDGEG